MSGDVAALSVTPSDTNQFDLKDLKDFSPIGD